MIENIWWDRNLFPFESRFVAVEGHRIHYVDEGRGPVLLFAHPGPAWSFYYREFILGLRDRFRCVAPDLPGFGLSEAREGFSGSLREHAQALEAFVETLGLRAITLLVHDSGGPIGLGAAVRQPGWFRAFILTSTFGWPVTDYPFLRLMLRLVSSPPFRLANASLNLLPWVAVNIAPVRRRLTKAERVGLVGAFRTWRQRDLVLALFRDLATDVEYLQEVEAGLRSRLADRPALLMYGENDPARRVGFDRRFASIFPRHQLAVIEAERHFPHLAAASEMVEHVRSFWPMVDGGTKADAV